MPRKKKQKKYKIVIVGSEQKYWQEGPELLARMFIKKIMEEYPDALFISGECPYGGIDAWVREIATYLDRDFKPFPPKKKAWYWYKKRNKAMAEAGDLIICIEPVGIVSGGTWTANYAEKLGKQVMRVEF